MKTSLETELHQTLIHIYQRYRKEVYIFNKRFNIRMEFSTLEKFKELLTSALRSRKWKIHRFRF